MKRIISLILVCLSLLSFSACGNGESSAIQQSSSSSLKYYDADHCFEAVKPELVNILKDIGATGELENIEYSYYKSTSSGYILNINFSIDGVALHARCLDADETIVTSIWEGDYINHKYYYSVEDYPYDIYDFKTGELIKPGNSSSNNSSSNSNAINSKVPSDNTSKIPETQEENTPGKLELMSYTQTVLNDYVSYPDYSSNTDDYEFISTGLRYKIEGKVSGMKFIIIFTFTDETYKEYDVNTLEIGGKNIFKYSTQPFIPVILI